MRDEVLPAAEALEQAGVRHPHTVAQLGFDTYAFLAERLDKLASELDGENPRA
jgi:hypothetical protein